MNIYKDTLTDQELFDFAVVTLSQMKSRSAIGSKCLYRCGDGNQCIVGRMLTDEEANGLDDIKTMGMTVSELHKYGRLPERFETKVVLLRSLQAAHDGPCNWTNTGFGGTDGVRELSRIADDFNLNTEVLDKTFKA